MAINFINQPSSEGTTGLPKHVIQLVSEAIDSASSELRRLNLEIWNNPETRFKEEKACKLLAGWFESQGWTVKTGVYGISTAFEARFSVTPGERSVCYNAEYDALPELGHACGHNLIATSTLASAVGTSAAMKELKIPGTLIVMGTPAEETGGGKYIMANHGAWKDCSVVLMTHAMPDFSTARTVTKASWKFRAKFHGKAAHAAAAPWNGNNACDAIVMAYNGLGLLRQQIQKTESIQSVILEAGKAPNIIPDYAEGSFSLRAFDSKALERLRSRVIPIFDGAAASTGCTVELFWDALYEDVVTNMALASRYTHYMINDLGLTPADILPPSDLSAKVDQNGSSDFGNCSYIQPGIQTLFSINATDMPHTPSFQKAAGTDFAHTESLRAGKANALIGLEVLLDEGFYKEVKSDWINDMKERGRLPE